ncbi:hypothetical protein JY390_06615 [Providencia stuartii]|nr:hypothetical protein JY390_06615 [Providencia stuartii]
MIMKLLAVAALLFSTSTIAANQCKPDNECLSFKTSESEISIACRNIESAKLNTYIDTNDSLAIMLKSGTGLSDFSVKNTGKTIDIYISGVKYHRAVITARMDTSIRIPITVRPNFKLVDDLIRCVN